jgi:hypothetical protein
MSYQMTDLSGRVLLMGRIENQRATVYVANLIPGTYLLRILVDQGKSYQKEIGTFKIIKN